MRVILLGPPGVGKGTQAKEIAQKYGIPAIATGDMLRASVEANTEVGKKAHEYMARGDLVPDNIIIACVEERLSQPDAQKGFLLDGFPRTVAQAEALDAMLARNGITLDGAVALDAPEDVIVERLGGRLTCPNCGAIFHQKHNPPKQESKCDGCTQNLVVREDDQPEAISNRLAVYKEKTAPVTDYYRAKGLLVQINGAQSPEAVKKEIQAALSK